jgi:iron(III) transport system permease protein
MTRTILVFAAVMPAVLGVFLPLAGLVVAAGAVPAAMLSAILAPATMEALVNTAILSAGATGVAVLLGLPLAVLLGRSDLPNPGAWRAAITLPYVLPPYVLTIAWMALLNPNQGALNLLARNVGLPTFNIYSLAGMIGVLGLCYTPLVALGVADALTRMDVSLEEQARIAGAGPFRAFLGVTLPLVAPAIVEGAALCLAASAAGFGVPYLLGTGSSTPTHVLTTRAVQALELDPVSGRPTAIALAILLLGVGLGLPALARALRGRHRVVTLTGKASRQTPWKLGRWRLVVQAGMTLFVAVAVGLPLATLLTTSLLGNVGLGLTPDNLTARHYVDLMWVRSDAWPALLRSAAIAAGAATVAVGWGMVVAHGQARQSLPFAWWWAQLARAPYAIPGTVLALGMVFVFSQEIRFIWFDTLTIAFCLADTVWLLGLAYLVKFAAFPVGSVEAGLQAIDPALEEAARAAGAGPLATLRRVVAPLLTPHLVSSWFLVFMAAFSEVTLSILLQGPDTRVVGTLLFELQAYGDPPAAAALGMVIAAIVLAANWIVRVLPGAVAST